MRIFNALAVFAIILMAGTAFAATLNEIRIDQPGSDLDEYFELLGTPGESLDGLTLIVIGDGATASGTIENVTDLTGYAIQADGVFAMGESTFSNTCGSIDAVGTLNFENSDNVTFFLVSGFTGAAGDDLDIDDDGILDAMPWTAIVDEISLVETADPATEGGDYYYSSVAVGPDGTFVPGHVAYCGGGWQILSFGLCEITETPGEPSDPNCGPVANDETSFGSVKALFR